jgi:hypothetical protein
MHYENHVAAHNYALLFILTAAFMSIIPQCKQFIIKICNKIANKKILLTYKEEGHIVRFSLSLVAISVYQIYKNIFEDYFYQTHEYILIFFCIMSMLLYYDMFNLKATLLLLIFNPMAIPLSFAYYVIINMPKNPKTKDMKIIEYGLLSAFLILTYMFEFNINKTDFSYYIIYYNLVLMVCSKGTFATLPVVYILRHFSTATLLTTMFMHKAIITDKLIIPLNYIQSIL